MDYKLKYKEALERARKLKENPIGVFYEYSPKEGDTICDYIFPELKESEDERIREDIKRAISVALDYSYFDNETANNCLAWLEKQGKQKSKNNQFTPEQASILYNHIDKFTKQNPADKVETKFHEGDWVVYNCDICQIVKREEGCNKLVTNFGIEKELVNERNLSTARLWTIHDAKPGDVLFVKPTENLGEQLIIFDGIDSDSRIKYYCRFLNNKFSIDGGLMGYDHKYFLPATKEQRDTLERAITNAGYGWSDKDRKLIKIVK